ncbi:MAG: hypothetical protein KDC98_12435 [Planctomycetes bacterium]|nr:hypothetical protein [Planctomycetota bacterium]
MKPVHILLLLAVTVPLLALLPTGQDPEHFDWAGAVDKACNSRRFQFRVAAAGKVAAGGDEAAAAISAWAAKNGRNALSSELAGAIAKESTTGDAVVELLLGWAGDREFYWRAYAFLGLARRARELPARRAALERLFTAHRDDPAWLVAAHSRLGLHLLDCGDRGASDADDPRLASKLCALLLEHGQVPPLQPLLDALADERTFQGDPWGQRMAMEAHKALQAALGDAHPLADGNAADGKDAAIAAVRAAIEKRWGQKLETPRLRRDPETPLAGGIAVQSCRDGDLYLQWTNAGDLLVGIDARPAVRLPAPIWDALSTDREQLALDSEHGVVICDNMRLRWTMPAIHSRIAPGSMPEAAMEWLVKLAGAIRDADKPDLSSALRAAIDQFGPR